MLGAALMAGASLISGLFGQSSAKKQAKKEEAAIRASNTAASQAAETMNAELRARADAAALVPVQTERESRSFIDMEGFMSAAEEHGFNPLTFLRSGALASFTHTEDWTCTTGERAMEAAQAGQYMPQLSPVIASTRVPSVGEVFGNAMQAGVNEFVGGLNQQQQNAFQMSLLQAQLQGANRVGAYNGSRSFTTPTAKLTGSTTYNGPGFFGQPIIGGSDPMLGWIKPHTPTGGAASVDTGRYGDMTPAVVGLGTYLVDGLLSAATNTVNALNKFDAAVKKNPVTYLKPRLGPPLPTQTFGQKSDSYINWLLGGG